jgi:hypothetical protein
MDKQRRQYRLDNADAIKKQIKAKCEKNKYNTKLNSEFENTILQRDRKAKEDSEKIFTTKKHSMKSALRSDYHSKLIRQQSR